MQIPDSVMQAYDDELALIESLRTFAGNRLRILAANHGWLFDDRIKSPESCLSKLDAGHKSLRDMNDLYAAMIVVPTQKYVDEARDSILETVNGRARPPRTIEASSFVYDDLHVIATLRGKVSPRAVPHPAVLDREFEIQIHTGVQYAWWRATHDELYKGSGPQSRSWGAQRASGQARAALELVDGVLGNFQIAAQLQPKALMELDSGQTVISWLGRWRSTSRPSDQIRFAKTIHTLTETIGVTLTRIGTLLERGDLDSYIGDSRITPAQAILIACHLIEGDAMFSKIARSGRPLLLLTEELLDCYPPLTAAPEDIRVQI